jgi:thiol-disulfide isomerase/thioredoxin
MIKQPSLLIVLIIYLLTACSRNDTSADYLVKVLNNLESIESATYNTTVESWFPGDTSALGVYHSIVHEYTNPSDTTIGSKFVRLNRDNPPVLEFCYDGEMRALVYHDDKNIVLDSFKINKLPFRPLTPPFFNYARSIIKYSLRTKDSISLDLRDSINFVYLRLMIFEDKKIEFFGKAFYMPRNEYDYGETTSSYELWIDKKSHLPYKVRREMFDQISINTCEYVELNTLDIKDFNASDYFPDDYSIEPYGVKGQRAQNSFFIGKEAPEWTLQTNENRAFSLSDMHSKIIMLQFTSVSCGPCKASIPFLKDLSTSYSKEDFDFVAIECSSRNANVLKSYMVRNNFDYTFLLSTKEVLKSYSITSFPVFFILDENRIVRNVIFGYGKGTTDQEIKTKINELI